MRAGFIFIAAVVAMIGPARSETITVTMKNIGYEPATISARVGDTIVWVNKDIVGHTATARDKAFDLMVLPNKTQSLIVKKAGGVDYYCRFHPNMSGHIDVAP